MRRASDRHGRAGFTLLEVAAAGVILSISAAVLGVAVRGGMRGLALTDEYRQAAGLLDRMLTKIEAYGPALVKKEGLTGGTFDEPYERFAWEADVRTRGRGDLYEVTVKITWRSAGGEPRSVEAQTLLHDPPSPTRVPPAWEDL